MLKYLVIAGLSVALLIGTYLYGYQRGKLKTEIKVIEKIVEVERESKVKTEQVRKDSQRLTDHELDRALCYDLHIVRGNKGCE